MKRTFLWISLLCLCMNAWAQKDTKAREILDKTTAMLRQAGGIQVTFEGTSQGTLQLKGDRFHLENGNMQSWFDGKTQWSYLKNSDEVTVSTPAPEELHTLNPYALLSAYKQGYDYRYAGAKSCQGQTGYEVVLTPDQPQELTSVTLFVSKTYQPLYLRVELTGQPAHEVIVTSFRTHQPLDDATFRFDQKKFPNAEVIDLRNHT